MTCSGLFNIEKHLKTCILKIISINMTLIFVRSVILLLAKSAFLEYLYSQSINGMYLNLTVSLIRLIIFY